MTHSHGITGVLINFGNMFGTLLKLASLPVAMAMDLAVVPLTGGDRSITAEVVKSLNK